jgi:hypothetical protein
MSILDNVKSVADTVHEIKNLELYARVLGIQGDIMELLEKNKQLTADIEELQGKLDLTAKMTFKQPFYYQEGDETPFCPACWEGHKKAIHLFVGVTTNSKTRSDCPSCKYQFWTGQAQSRMGSASRLPRGEHGWME